MPFTSTGRDIEMVNDPRTGRLTFDWDAGGNPKYGDSRTHAVASLVIEKRGLWAQDKTGTRGSTLHQIRNDRTRTPSEIESAIRDALEPLVRAGEISELRVVPNRVASGVYRPIVYYKTPDGVQRSVEV